MPHRRKKHRTGFTLIEFFVVLIIIIILAIIATILLNPSELMRQGRDAQRLAEFNSVNKALRNMSTDNTGLTFGDAYTVYVSLPSDDPQCADMNLPPLPPGWSYHCRPSGYYRNADGTGWIPVNFRNTSFGPQFSTLPIDPINYADTGFYYTYVPTNQSWELTALLESEKQQKTSLSDGGISPGVFETGPAPNITPPTRDTSLIGYWRFEEGAGTVAYDSSGEGSHSIGTLPQWTYFPDWTLNGKAGGAVDFCPTCPPIGNPKITVTSTIFESIVGQQPFSISAWIKTDTINSIRRGIVAKGDGFGFGGQGFGMHIVNGTVLFGYQGDTGGVVIPFPAILSVGTWFHITSTYTGTSGTNARIYVNGTLKASGNISSIISHTGRPLTIGYFTYSAQWGAFDGIIDEVRIYNRALSDAEVSALFNGGH